MHLKPKMSQIEVVSKEYDEIEIHFETLRMIRKL